jgi:hypothetical protein
MNAEKNNNFAIEADWKYFKLDDMLELNEILIDNIEEIYAKEFEEIQT